MLIVQQPNAFLNNFPLDQIVQQEEQLMIQEQLQEILNSGLFQHFKDGLILMITLDRNNQQQVEQLFDIINQNKSGFIDKDEFQSFMYADQHIQLKLTEKKFRQMMMPESIIKLQYLIQREELDAIKIISDKFINEEFDFYSQQSDKISKEQFINGMKQKEREDKIAQQYFNQNIGAMLNDGVGQILGQFNIIM